MQHINDLITSFINDEISPEDFAELKAWAFSSEENRAYFRNYLELWFSTSMADEEKQFDSEAAFARFKSRVIEHNNCFGKEVKKKQGRVLASGFRKKMFWAIAAAAAILLLVAPYATYNLGKKNTEELFGLVQLTAPSGSTLDLALPDGTIVKLNSSSKLSYNQGFGITDRTVTLDGEAYFEVEHNEKLPFIVDGDRLEIIDIGTIFKICNYAVNPTATVDLLDGKISVRTLVNNNEIRTMHPGEQLKIDKTTGTFIKEQTRHTDKGSAEFDTYIFENESIKDIALRLSQLYNTEIIVEDSIAASKFYGSIDRKQQTIEEVLDILQTTEHLRYRKEGNTYHLY